MNQQHSQPDWLALSSADDSRGVVVPDQRQCLAGCGPAKTLLSLLTQLDKGSYVLAVLSLLFVGAGAAHAADANGGVFISAASDSAAASGKSGGIGGTGSGANGRQSLISTADTAAFSLNSGKYQLRENSAELHTELEFRLRPGKFDFSAAGVFGLGGFFSNPEFELRSLRTDKYELEYSMPELHEGLSYSAGFNIEHENAHISDTAYVSSGQLGVSYGRMGRVWYSGVDLSIQQSAITADDSIKSESLSFDLTTGRRLGWTGLGAGNPLWLLSLRGDFDLQNEELAADGLTVGTTEWYINPSLFWDTQDFRFAAQLEVPLDRDVIRDFDPPSYKLRAVIEKNF